MKVVMVDYGVGNTRSIKNAFSSFGVDVQLTKRHDEILNADGLILPGVGAYSHGMSNLHEYGLVETLRTYAELDKPLLGICLGMQLLMDESEEFGLTKGLGIIPGKVIKLGFEETVKLPHVSWTSINTKNICWDNTILSGMDSGEDAYFVHSYVAVPDNDMDILSVSNYGSTEFCSTINKGKVFGCQYHPEKSSFMGLKIINNFINICK